MSAIIFLAVFRTSWYQTRHISIRFATFGSILPSSVYWLFSRIFDDVCGVFHDLVNHIFEWFCRINFESTWSCSLEYVWAWETHPHIISMEIFDNRSANEYSIGKRPIAETESDHATPCTKWMQKKKAFPEKCVRKKWVIKRKHPVYMVLLSLKLQDAQN